MDKVLEVIIYLLKEHFAPLLITIVIVVTAWVIQCNCIDLNIPLLSADDFWDSWNHVFLIIIVFGIAEFVFWLCSKLKERSTKSAIKQKDKENTDKIVSYWQKLPEIDKKRISIIYMTIGKQTVGYLQLDRGTQESMVEYLKNGAWTVRMSGDYGPYDHECIRIEYYDMLKSKVTFDSTIESEILKYINSRKTLRQVLELNEF